MPAMVQHGHQGPHPTISVLNQYIDDDGGVYRIRYGDRVGYVIIVPADAFEEDTMCRPDLLVPKLQDLLPTSDWTRVHMRRDAVGGLVITITDEPLLAVHHDIVWHYDFIAILSLQEVKRHNSRVHEVFWDGKTAIAKFAAFEWEVPGMERETWAYSVLDKYQREHPDEALLSPRVLGHLTEGGRVMGLLLEKIEGSFASIEDLDTCENAIRRLHAMNLVHGDVDRDKFIIDQDGQVKLVDFERSSLFGEERALKDLVSLEAKLKKETSE